MLLCFYCDFPFSNISSSSMKYFEPTLALSHLQPIHYRPDKKAHLSLTVDLTKVFHRTSHIPPSPSPLTRFQPETPSHTTDITPSAHSPITSTHSTMKRIPSSHPAPTQSCFYTTNNKESVHSHRFARPQPEYPHEAWSLGAREGRRWLFAESCNGNNCWGKKEILRERIIVFFPF